jgi:site-specific DNA-methyltransferase (adenine-specific)
MTVEFQRGDSLQLIKKIKSETVNLLYIDPPFGTTAQFWDEKIDWEKLFPEMFRVLKDTGMLVIHCSVPFNYELIRAAKIPPAYSWYWKKEGVPTNYLNANHQPLRCVEEILVWKKKKNTYYRQQIGDEERVSYWASPSDYYGTIKERKKTIVKGKTRTHFLEMKRSIDGFSTRPKEMVELMIKSYSAEGDTVLDLFCYKGLSGLVCRDLKRNWIGFDKYHSPDLLFDTEPN